jgi:outer membrane lipoprotein SlyB
MKLKHVLSCFCALGLLSGCAKDMKPGNYDAAEIGKVKKVVAGVIISKRPVKFHSTTAAANGDGYSESATNPSRGFEYVIKLSNGEIVSIAQSEDLKLKVKQHILMIQGENTRIVPDDGSDDD